ncbi:MAG: sarcosine oxidase subunit gamma SoxG [Deltaproteobacteria bacterium]|nr:MAG: sarcosine oxidase subunit gamma SoxG [Deltaproteobacteria bacterium]
MTNKIIRRSPVTFGPKPSTVENRGHWVVALEYEGEGDGPHLIDLSHCPRWDFQDGNLDKFKPVGISIPKQPGICVLSNGTLINRMNGTQAAVWHLSGEATDIPPETGYTDVTDATVFLAIMGRNAFAITEKLSALDLNDPARTPPFLIQGPFSHVPCQIVVMAGDRELPVILLACSRGYAHDMVDAILHAGHEFGLQPAGENVFKKWLEPLK